MNVSFNVAMSVDGKIGPPDRSHVSLGTAEDHRRMSALRRAAGAVILGGATLRATPFASVEVPASPPRATPLWNVVMTRTADLPLSAQAFKEPRVRWLVLAEQGAAPARVEQVRRVAEVELLQQVTPQAVLDALRRRGVEQVLIEAGGQVAGQFCAAGLVDDFYITLTPWLLGGKGAPSPVDGVSWPKEQWPRLKLVEATPLGDEVFLHYRRA